MGRTSPSCEIIPVNARASVTGYFDLRRTRGLGSGHYDSDGTPSALMLTSPVAHRHASSIDVVRRILSLMGMMPQLITSLGSHIARAWSAASRPSALMASKLVSAVRRPSRAQSLCRLDRHISSALEPGTCKPVSTVRRSVKMYTGSLAFGMLIHAIFLGN
ncbi:hypothetical protein EXIGLDRAFT_495402 [Exidia glandulosa HHB12029]|uniref:Uncharacterized protein n=1 Tax=Exidia glandulosa HHB12029 TaxID=1314781 RepID=A0A166N9U4_EXIGL|nr:hypothetical protein EXIGLDRAFT_495402 [Exidia glandulosa HHB12029]